MPIRLIASDMDQSLLLSTKQLPVGTFDRITALARAGIEFVAASGRAVYTLEAMFAPVLDRMTLVAENGAVIKRHGQLLATELLQPNDYWQVRDFARAQGRGVPFVCAMDQTVLEQADDGHEATLRHFITNMAFVPDLRDCTVPAPKTTVYLPDGSAYTAMARQYRPRFGAQYTVTVGGPTFIDIMSPRADKGQALAWLGQHLGIPTAAMMAFGDTDNDIAMMQTVGYGVLMANATPNMQAYARYCTASNDDRGVLLGIDRVLAGQLPARLT
ncbi:HAD family hydrolase [Lacticaseibacillus absianus]|uniref:HAD family hydrolase n=1 Tax=Lacticaseibacillus absianus TaxID=2729623 RepID=UPI001FE2DC9B|nr:HAD family hydrolase [Lacticaseibacillus absianus]